MPTNANASAGGSARGVKSSVKSNVAIEDRIALPAAAQDGEKSPPYGREINAALKNEQPCNVYIFAGKDAWNRAKQRRKSHGICSALILPESANPLELKWPPLPEVVVCWPGRDEFYRKLSLAQALIRDGVHVAHIEHVPEWIRARAKAVS